MRYAMVVLATVVALPLAAASVESLVSSERQGIIRLIANASVAKPDEVVTMYEAALSLAEDAQDYVAAAALHNALGQVFEEQHQLQSALAYYEQGAEILRTHQVPSAKSYNRRSEVGTKGYTTRVGAPVSVDLYQARMSNLEKVLSQPESAVHSQLLWSLALNAGNMYLHQNQYDQADRYYQQALAAARSQHDQIHLQGVLANMAWSAIKQGKLDLAERVLEEALSADLSSSRGVPLPSALVALGVSRREQGEYARGIADLERASALYNLTTNNLGSARALAHLATAVLQQGDIRRAQSLYLEARQLNERVDDPEIAWHANVGLAKVHDRLGEYADALNYYSIYWSTVLKRGLSFETDPGRTSYLEDHDRNFSEYASVAVKAAANTGNYAAARQIIEQRRARILMSLESSLSNRSQYSSRIAVPGHLPASYVLGDADAYEKQCALGIRVMNASPESNQGCYAGFTESLAQLTDSLSDVRPKNESSLQLTYLEYYVLDDQVAIFVKTGNGEIHGTSVKIGANDLERLVEDYLDAMGVKGARGVQAAPQSQDWMDLSSRLYTLLLQPVESLLPSDPTLPIVVVPHRSLWRLPFASLRDDQERYLGDRHLISYAPSEGTLRLVALRSRKHDHRDAKAWVVGNPRMPDTMKVCGDTVGLSRLPGAQKEAEEVAALFGRKGEVQLFVEKQADRLRFQAWYRNFTVLHFATHGFACPDQPLDSFVLFADLTGDDVMLNKSPRSIAVSHDRRLPIALDLSRGEERDKTWDQQYLSLDRFHFSGRLTVRVILTRFTSDADLVTLSACQTGLGKLMGEGMIGFPRAFLATGTRSVLASLWSVDDQATKDLMIAFYQQYLEHGNKGLALQRAMRQTRGAHPSPASWASFSLYGLSE